MPKVTVEFSVADPKALHEQAVKDYVGSDTSEEKLSDALNWLGTADDPKLDHCVVEVIFERFANDTFGIEF